MATTRTHQADKKYWNVGTGQVAVTPAIRHRYDNFQCLQTGLAESQAACSHEPFRGLQSRWEDFRPCPDFWRTRTFCHKCSPNDGKNKAACHRQQLFYFRTWRKPLRSSASGRISAVWAICPCTSGNSDRLFHSSVLAPFWSCREPAIIRVVLLLLL